jgi:hypothetical protein
MDQLRQEPRCIALAPADAVQQQQLQGTHAYRCRHMLAAKMLETQYEIYVPIMFYCVLCTLPCRLYTFTSVQQAHATKHMLAAPKSAGS